jgi:4-diphosphocytidyl-2-C-methyl-D-erythritol kinase
MRKNLKRIRENSFAKLNMGLLIKGKRADGFHNIETIFVSVSLRDTVYMNTSSCTRIICSNPEVPQGEDNLAYRAVQRFKKRTGLKKHASIEIIKRIPIGAGLAGGSGNGSAVVRGLNRLWSTGLSQREMLGICTGIGSDVPYTLTGGTVLGTGKGTNMRILPDFPRFWVILICPDLHISTSWAYSQAKYTLTKKFQKINLYGLYLDFLAKKLPLSSLLVNQFEDIVFKRYPKVKELKEEIQKCNPLGACMSGSGPSMFAVFKQRSQALGAAEKLRNAGSRKVFVCRIS